MAGDFTARSGGCPVALTKTRPTASTRSGLDYRLFVRRTFHHSDPQPVELFTKAVPECYTFFTLLSALPFALI